MSVRSPLAVMCSGDIHCNYLVANDHSGLRICFSFRMLECDGGCKLWNGWEEIAGEKLCVRLCWELCCMQGKADVECVYVCV